MNDDARAALDAIAYGDDASITPGDRLRAIDALADLPDPGAPLHERCPCDACEVRRMVAEWDEDDRRRS